MEEIVTRWPDGDGEMAARIRAFAWSRTPLGPAAAWSERLKLMVEQVLASPLVSSLACGPERVLIYNDAAAKLYGDRHPAALGRPLPETFPEGWATVAPLYDRAFAGQTVEVGGQPLDTRGEGEASDVFDALLTPVRAADGHVAFVHMTGSEIGARARTEAALRESETRYRLLIESWAQAEWETDADGVVVADSPSWRAYTGQTLDEWLGYGWVDAIHPDDRAYAERQWREAVAARGLVDAEFRLRAPDGGWRWTNVRAAPLLDAGGQVERWVGVNIDVDGRKRAEAALRESERKYRTIFETMGQGYVEAEVVRDADGRAVDSRLIELNPAFERLTGVPVAAARGRTNREIFPGIEDWWAQTADRVVRGGVPASVDYAVATLDRYYQVHFYPTAGDRYTAVYEDITDRKRAEKVLHEREERQAFLLKLSDGLRPLLDAVEIQAEASRILRAQLGADRVAYAELDPDEDTAKLLAEDRAAHLVSFVGAAYAWSAFDQVGHGEARRGRSTSRADVQAADDLGPEQKAAFAAVQCRAVVTVPLRKSGRLVAFIAVHFEHPHETTPADVALVEETAERTWAAVERSRVERSLRESEARFQQFARASAAGLWIREAETLAMEFVSPAIGSIYGVGSNALLGDVKHWAAMIVPEDRESAFAHLEAARRGEVAAHEFRIQRPSDGAFRWIRNTDFPLHDDGRISRIGGIAEDVTEARLAAEHSAVLLAELQHRVRNIMAVIRAITARTGERAESVPAYAEAMAGRLMTLARVQALLTRAANAGVGIADIVRDELGAQAEHAGQYVLDGPDLVLSPKAAEVLTLAVHELTTNALKYGGLSVPDGRVTVRWTTFEKRGTSWLGFDWIEAGAPERPPAGPVRAARARLRLRADRGAHPLRTRRPRQG